MSPTGTATGPGAGVLERVALPHPRDELVYEELCRTAPHLADAFLGFLPRARALTLRRLVSALWREDVAGLRTRGRLVTVGGTRIAGDRNAGDRNAAAGDPTGDLLAGQRPGTWLVTPVAAPDGTGTGTGTGRGALLLAAAVLAVHGFGRLEVGDPVLVVPAGPGVAPAPAPARALADAVDLVGVLRAAGAAGAWEGLATELADSTANLALALARAEVADRATRRAAASLGARDCVELARLAAERDPVFEPTVFLEKLSTHGHNLHPCARTRLGMSPADLLRHDVESPYPTGIALVAVRRDRTDSATDRDGRDVGAILLDAYPDLAAAADRAGVDRCTHLLLPVHGWQLDRVVRDRFAADIERGDVVPVPGVRLPAEPTITLRTLLTEPAPDGTRYFVKTALDIQVTSTRRTVSVQTAVNGPRVSALLDRIAATDPVLSHRLVVLPELAGASYRGDRSLSALVRAGFAGRLRPGETAVPGCALYAPSPLAGDRDRRVLADLVDRFRDHRDEPRADLAALLFLDEYASVLLGVTLRLLTRFGVGLEAHLQNAVPTFVDGVPTRVVFRDWGGIRIHLPRLGRRGLRLDAREGSVTVTRDIAVARSKVAYTVLQNHLAELVAGLTRSHGVGERAAWRTVRAVAVRVLSALGEQARRDGDTALARDVAGDTRALLAPTLPYKALVSMRLHPDGGDRYVDVPNPLWDGP